MLRMLPAAPALGSSAPNTSALDASQDHGSRAHGAGLESHIEGGFGQPPPADDRRRVAEDEHLGMSGGIVPALALVAPGRHHLASDGQHCSDGHLSLLPRPTGLVEGEPIKRRSSSGSDGGDAVKRPRPPRPARVLASRRQNDRMGQFLRP